MKTKYFLIIFLSVILSCKEKTETNSLTKENKSKDFKVIENEVPEYDTLKMKNSNLQIPIEFDKSKLGEDLKEINCYVRKIYQKDNLTFVDIDVVKVIITPEGKRTIINENPKIRTYIVDKKTIIYSHNCDRITQKELIKIKNNKLKDKSIIIVGSSKNGVLESLNFGCYG